MEVKINMEEKDKRIMEKIEADKATSDVLELSDYQKQALWYLELRFGMDNRNLMKQALNEFISRYCTERELKEVDYMLKEKRKGVLE